MLTQEVSAEQFAESFHRYFHALAQDFGCPDPFGCDVWEQASPQERSCLIAAARLTLMEFSSASVPSPEKCGPDESRRYFAKPGEAEWGC